MKALLGLFLFCACVFIGNGKTGALKVRKQVLSAMEKDIRCLADQMELHAKPIGALTAQFEPNTEAFWAIFRERLSGEGTVGDIWKTAMEEAAKMRNGFEGLSKEERAVLYDFGAGLTGKGIAQQRANVDVACKRLQRCVGLIEEELSKKGKMYESLGVLAGLALALLVI